MTNKKAFGKKLLCFLLTAVILLGSNAFTFTSAELDSAPTTGESTDVQPERIPVIEDAESSANEIIKTQKLDLSTVPDAVGKEKASAQGHVERLYAEEKDLNTVVFANADGTKTAYYFDSPVKYADENGKTKDISLNIVQNSKTGSFISESAKATAVFSEKLSDGIMLEDGGVSLRLVPVFGNTQIGITPIKPELSVMGTVSGNTGAVTNSSSPTAELINNKTVVYDYDGKTSYEYSLTYSGFKEDIVVSEYTGQTEYTFTLYTNGLTLSADSSGDHYLYDADGNIKASVGDIVIFTADERNNAFGTLTAKAVKENEEYTLTIHIDAEYLADEKTKYPIRIDPTIEICYDNNGAGAIHDVTINSVEAISGTSGSISAGKYGDDQSISRILMKFPTLDLSSMDVITSATVYIRDLMCQSEALTLDCYIFNGSTWTETSTVDWSTVNANNYAESLLDTHEISYSDGLEMDVSHYYDYDITDALEAWKDNTANIAKGIIFKAAQDHEDDTTHNYKTFASYNRANYKPYLVVVYNGSGGSNEDSDVDYIIEDFDIIIERNYILVGESLSVSVSSEGSFIWSSTNSSVLQISNITVQEDSKTITGLAEGTATINVMYDTGSVSEPIIKTYTLSVVDSLGLADATAYYIMNSKSERFLALGSLSNNAGTPIETEMPSTMSSSKWITNFAGNNGKCRLISVYASTPIMNMIYDDSVGVVLDEFEGDTLEKSSFEIYRINDATNQGKYIIRQKGLYLLEDSNHSLYLSSVLNDSGYWTFMKCGTGYANLISFRYDYVKPTDGGIDEYNTTYRNQLFESSFSNLGYSACAYTNPSASSAFGLLKHSDVFVYRGHSAPGVLAFQTTNNALTGTIKVSQYLQYSANDYSLDSISKNGLQTAQCILYIGCSTGVDLVTNNYGVLNLCDATYELGAHFVVGTTFNINQGNEFMQVFLSNVNSLTIREAALLASLQLVESDVAQSIGSGAAENEQSSIYMVGDGDQYLYY